MFRTMDAVERYLGSHVLLPETLPGWHGGVIRTVVRGADSAFYHVSIEYQLPDQSAHILAWQASSNRGVELPAGPGIEGRETHEVDGVKLTIFWLRMTEGSRIVGHWNRDGVFLAATVSTEDDPPLPFLLDLVVQTASR